MSGVPGPGKYPKEQPAQVQPPQISKIGTHDVKPIAKEEGNWITNLFSRFIAFLISLFSSKPKQHEFQKLESLLSKDILSDREIEDAKLEIARLRTTNKPDDQIRPLLEKYANTIKVPSPEDDNLKAVQMVLNGIKLIETFSENLSLPLQECFEEKRQALEQSKQSLILRLQADIPQIENSLVPRSKTAIDPRTDLLGRLSEIEITKRPEDPPEQRLELLEKENQQQLTKARDEEKQKAESAKTQSGQVANVRTSINNNISTVKDNIELLKIQCEFKPDELNQVEEKIKELKRFLGSLDQTSPDYKTKTFELKALEAHQALLTQKKLILGTINKLEKEIEVIAKLGKERDWIEFFSQEHSSIEQQLEQLKEAITTVVEKCKRLTSDEMLKPFSGEKVQLQMRLAYSEGLFSALKEYSEATSKRDKDVTFMNYMAFLKKNLPPEKFKDIKPNELRELLDALGPDGLKKRIAQEQDFQKEAKAQLDGITKTLDLVVSLQKPIQALTQSAKDVLSLKQSLPGLIKSSLEAYDDLGAATKKREAFERKEKDIAKLKQDFNTLAVNFVIGAKSAGTLKKFVRTHLALSLLQGKSITNLEDQIFQGLKELLLVPSDERFQNQLHGYIKEFISVQT